jgi:DNA polymerase-3 subunit beta
VNIKEAIITAASAAQARGTMPILTTVAIKAVGGVIEFTGTDLQVGIKTTAQYGTKDFSCCIDARKLVAAIGVIDMPQFSLAGNNLVIKQGRTRFTLPAFPFENHPGLQVVNGTGVEIDSDIVKLMAEVRYAAGKNDARLFLNGVYLNAEKGKLSVAASDGHRISLRTAPIDGEFKIILPVNAVNQIIKYRPDKMIIGDVIHCLKDDFEMVCNAIDAKYPDFTRVLNSGSDSFTVSRDEFQKTLVALNVLRDTTSAMAVHMQWRDDMLTASSMGGDRLSEAENQMPATYTKEGEIAICLHYLIDLMGAVSGDDLELSFDEQRSISSSRENAMDLIMSMKL